MSMPGYINKPLLRFRHGEPPKVKTGQHRAPSTRYGTGAQDPIPADTLKKFDIDRIHVIQQVVRGVLYYVNNVNNTMLMSLSTIASE